jgi:hypothetical protein
MLKWAGLVARMGELRDVYKRFVGKTEGRSPLWKLRCRWDDTMDQDGVPVAGSCEHGNVPPGFIKGGEFLVQLMDSAAHGLNPMSPISFRHTGFVPLEILRPYPPLVISR